MVFQVTVYTEDDGSITLSMDDMDLVVNAPSKEASIKTLCRDMVEYAEEYRKEHGEAPEWMPNQYFAALTNMRSVGVMGDERTYDYAVALRAVNTVDFMTAEAANIPFEVLQKVMSRIINEVKGVNRCFYDITSKPPGTIEFE